jgi:hypothetical protein
VLTEVGPVQIEVEPVRSARSGQTSSTSAGDNADPAIRHHPSLRPGSKDHEVFCDGS